MAAGASDRHAWYRKGVPCGLVLLLMLTGMKAAEALPLNLGGGFTGSLKTSVSLGAALRMQSPNPALIGKLNLPGQYSFCEDKMGGVNCSSVAGNAQYLALPGAASVNGDDGDLNYGKGQLISAVFRIVPELKLRYRGIGLDVSAYAFYDPVNEYRHNHHPNNIGNNGFQSATTSRPASVKRDLGADVRLENAYLYGNVPVGDYSVNVKLGKQLVNWGTSLTLLLNGVSTINPPDATILTMPGAQAGNFLIPEPLIDLESDLSDSLSVEGFYQFAWQPARIPPDGSYFSTNDLLGDGGQFAMLDFGKYREDPHDQVGKDGRIQGALALLTKAGRTLYRGPDHDPGSQGEYGFRLSYFAYWLNDTSFGLYFHNLHSRFPFGSFVAAQKGCLSDATNQVNVILACRGFANVPGGKEPLPLDTAHYFADYPENIRMIGASFSTNLGQVAWTGEVAFRPNQPLQINPVDLGFAALRPTLPAKTISLVVVDIPGRNVAFPDYVEPFRHQTVQPGQIIPGYQRFKTIQYDTSFVVVRGHSGNPFGADRLVSILELGAYQIMNLPSLNQLQLAAPGAYFHHSAGIDGSGTPNADQAAAPAKDRINPHYQAGGFASRWSYGFRLITTADYQNLIPGDTVSPQLAFFDDLGGRSPLPTGQFLSGRKQLKLGVKLTTASNQGITTLLRYTWIWGGGAANLMSDRDYLEWSIEYDF